MTREEAIEQSYINHGYSASNKIANILINKIYDDFESRTCEWEVDEDAIYSTSCHNMWQFTEGDLTDNDDVKFCPYCGSKIVSTDTKS